MKNNGEAGLQDIEWAVGLNRTSLRLMGAWPERRTKLSGTVTIPIMVLSMFCFGYLPQMYALYLVRNNLHLVIDNVMASFPALISCAKLTIFWLNKEVLRPVVESMEKDWLREKQSWEYDTMRRSAVIGKYFTLGGYLLVTATMAGFFVMPLCGIDIRLVTNITDYGPYPLVVQSYYPFDYSISPLFPLIHLSQVLSCSMVAMAIGVPDNYFGVLLFHLSGQFEILGDRLENLIRRNDVDCEFSRKLGACVDRHVHLIEMATTVEKSFNLIIFSQVLCLFNLAVCLGFRILHIVRNPGEKVSVIQIVNLLGGLFFLLMCTLSDCTASETLAHHTSELHRKVYASKWYMHPDLPTRDLTLMMIVSKKPMMLTAGKFMYLSMSTYCSILKSIGGYVSVLIAVSGR